MSDDEREERELDLTSPEVVTKYKSAAEIINSKNSSPFYVYVTHFVCNGCFIKILLKDVDFVQRHYSW